MDPNLSWLCWAYGIGWALIFIYLFQLSRREVNLRRKIADLQARVEEHWKR
jgi:hypothetical protein